MQVETLDSRESAWFTYENKVYDGTKFLNDHPGGPESILIVAGQVSVLMAWPLQTSRSQYFIVDDQLLSQSL